MSIEKIHNWVVVMFENRSFDSLLGYLPHIDSADGLRDKNITLPYPGGTVKVGPTGNFTDPIPDPGRGLPQRQCAGLRPLPPREQCRQGAIFGFSESDAVPV